MSTTYVSTIRTEATALLEQLTGVTGAQFHDGQFEAIEALVSDRRRALVVQRTGWGKSAVYFIASLLLRRAGSGPAIIVSPLLALMRDQLSAASRAGVRAAAINSANTHEWDAIEESIAADELDVLLLSPERLNNPRFRTTQLPRLLATTGLLVVDEAHCISDWGHDFRPDYRRIRDIVAQLPAGTPVLATTATANSRVVDDVSEQLGVGEDNSEVFVLRGTLARASLRLGVHRAVNSDERTAWLLDHFDDFVGSGIVYCLTVSGAEDLASDLREAGHNVAPYTGRTDPESRAELEARLKNNDVKALIATSALGMGFDKPDLGFVIHVGAPSSAVAYYQQIGRAGRGGNSADVLLLPGQEDTRIWEYFATASMPNKDRAAEVLAVLADGTPRSVPAMESLVPLKRSPLELLLKVLEVEGAVEKVRGGYISTGKEWVYDEDRYTRIAQTRRDEASAMLEYERLESCRMLYLTKQLDDPSAANCGRCDNCTSRWWSTDVSEHSREVTAQANARIGILVDPRAQWPSGMSALGMTVKGKIPPELRAENGRVVARLTDLGWGTQLARVLAAGASDEPVSDAIFQAVVSVLAEWDWDERPQAVTSIPSATRPVLVESLAARLAETGRMQWLGPMQPVAGGPTGGPDVNSAFRVRGVHGRLELSPEQAEAALGKPVLLVDDYIVSRWTMTVAATVLREAGATSVLPLALALRA